MVLVQQAGNCSCHLKGLTCVCQGLPVDLSTGYGPAGAFFFGYFLNLCRERLPAVVLAGGGELPAGNPSDFAHQQQDRLWHRGDAAAPGQPSGMVPCPGQALAMPLWGSQGGCSTGGVGTGGGVRHRCGASRVKLILGRGTRPPHVGCSPGAVLSLTPLHFPVTGGSECRRRHGKAHGKHRVESTSRKLRLIWHRVQS